MNDGCSILDDDGLQFMQDGTVKSIELADYHCPITDYGNCFHQQQDLIDINARISGQFQFNGSDLTFGFQLNGDSCQTHYRLRTLDDQVDSFTVVTDQCLGFTAGETYYMRRYTGDVTLDGVPYISSSRDTVAGDDSGSDGNSGDEPGNIPDSDNTELNSILVGGVWATCEQGLQDNCRLLDTDGISFLEAGLVHGFEMEDRCPVNNFGGCFDRTQSGVGSQFIAAGFYQVSGNEVSIFVPSIACEAKYRYQIIDSNTMEYLVLADSCFGEAVGTTAYTHRYW
ncbi:hypothetical protein GCM10011297_21050 [Bacterioplanes sanyensis]|nr:hypothetical protein GCM10011297_21050 [Bacterioplanes sanyensis]